MGLSEKTEKLNVSLEKYKSLSAGDLDLISKDKLADDFALLAEIAIILSDKIVQIDNQVLAWELSSQVLDEVDSPYFAGANATLKSAIKNISSIIDSDL